MAVLRRYAPLWLAQLAGLMEAAEREAVQRHVQGSSQERMLRELAEAIEQLTGEELRLLGRIQEPMLAIQLHTHLGTSSMVCGALRQAQEHHARVLELYNPQWHREVVLRFGIDPAVTAGAVSGWSLWLAGWPDQARARAQQGLCQARKLDHRFSLVLASINAARVHLWCGEVNDAERFAEEGASLAREDDVVEFIRAGGILLACIRVQRGEPEGGVSLLAEMVAQYRSAEILYLFPLHLSSLADAYWQVGRVEEGLATIAEALHTTETSAAAFWAAEVYRLKGELTLSQSRASLEQGQGKSRTSQKTEGKRRNKFSVVSSQVSGLNSQHPTPRTQAEAEAVAEGCFLQALEIARQQEAKSLELRAAMSLSRLWQQQGKSEEARKLLAEIYGWFTEGFATQDLREAQDLLASLGPRSA